jgi:type I restriction enzyme S subunit
MSVVELKPGWKMVKFGEVVKNANLVEREPEANGVERIVGLEHIDPENLHVRRWNSVADGTSFTRKFLPGQTLFGKRRAYQRKVAYAEFKGICSGDILTFEPKDKKVLLPELLPFICQSDAFFEHALDTSAGSLSPRTSWTALKGFEFPLPPPDEQKRIIEILWAADEAVEKYKVVLRDTVCIRDQSFLSEVLSSGWPTKPTSELSVAPVTKGTTPKKGEVTEPATIPFIKVYNLTFTGDLDFTVEPTYVDKNTHENGLARSIVLPNDILINIVGPPLGKISVVPSVHSEWNMNQAIARIRIEDSLLRKYFVAFFKTDHAQNWFQKHSKKTSGQQNLTLKIVQDFPVPLPPEDELKRILAVFDSADESVKAARKQISALEALIKGLINRDLAHV